MNKPDGIDLEQQIVRMKGEYEHCKELHGEGAKWAIEAGSILASLLELQDRRNINRPHILSKDCWCKPDYVDPHLDVVTVPVEPDVSPEWIPKQYRKTTGGQIVGWKPLMCESNGGSDYCMHCGRDMGVYANRPPCEALERRRLAMIPNEMVQAFGCRNEAFHAENGEPTEGEACEKWCRRPACPASFKEKP